jgi:hypothetical protein
MVETGDSTVPRSLPCRLGAWLRARPVLALALFVFPAIAVARVVRLRGLWQEDGLPVGWDLTSFLTGARLLASDDAARLYDFAREREVALAHFPGSYRPFPFVSPPFVAFAVWPLVLVPYPVAFTLWSLAGLAATGAGLRALLGPKPSGAIVALALGSLPFVYALLSGQPTLFTFALVAILYRAVAERRLGTAGALAGLLLYKPQAVFGLAVYFVVRTRDRGWLRLWASFVGVAGVLVAASWLLWPDASRAYVRVALFVLPHFLATAGFDPAQVLSFRAFFDLLLGDQRPLGEGLALAFVLAGVVACVAYWARRRAWDPSSERAVALDFGAAVVLGVWCAPHASIYDWTVLAVPFALAWRHLPERRDAVVFLFAALAVTTLSAQPLAEAMRSAWSLGFQVDLPVLGALALLARSLLDSGDDATHDAPRERSRRQGLS